MNRITIVLRKILMIYIIVNIVCLYSVVGYANKTKIAVVNSYHEEYKWVQEVNKGINDYRSGKAMLGLKPISKFGSSEIKYFYMDAKRHPGDKAYLSNKGREIINHLILEKPSIVIICDDEALEYVAAPLKNNKEFKFVFLGINNDPRKYGVVKDYNKPEFNITGLLSEHPFLNSMRLMLKLFSDTKKIIVFFDDSASGRGIHDNLNKHIKFLDNNSRELIKDTIVSNDWELWKKTILANQQQGNMFVFGSFYTLHNNEDMYISDKDVIQWIVKNSMMPELTILSSSVDAGMLFSMSNPGYVHGYEASHIAGKILNGTEIKNIPVNAPTSKAIHVNMDRAKQIGASIPVDIIAIAKYYESLGY